MKNKPTICILGGMGPQASARFLALLIDKAGHDLKVDEKNFPEIIVDSVPVPDFISTLANKNLALTMLKARVLKLNAFDPDCFAIACNTAHVLLGDLQKKTESPFISLIDEVSKKVSLNKIKKVGILATPVTIHSCLYQDSLDGLKIEAIIPHKNQLSKLEGIIRRVLSYQTTENDKAELVSISKLLKLRGAEAIILGCTELPLVFPRQKNLKVFDCLDILSDAILSRFYGGKSE